MIPQVVLLGALTAIAVSFAQPPPDLADVEALARRAAAHLASPH